MQQPSYLPEIAGYAVVRHAPADGACRSTLLGIFATKKAAGHVARASFFFCHKQIAARRRSLASRGNHDPQDATFTTVAAVSTGLAREIEIRRNKKPYTDPSETLFENAMILDGADGKEVVFCTQAEEALFDIMQKIVRAFSPKSFLTPSPS